MWNANKGVKAIGRASKDSIVVKRSIERLHLNKKIFFRMRLNT